MNSQLQFHVTTDLTGEGLKTRLEDIGSYLNPEYVKSPYMTVDRQTGRRAVGFLFGPANVAMRAEFAKTGTRASDRRFHVVIKPGKGHERFHLKRYSKNEFGRTATQVFHEILDKVLRAGATKYGEVTAPVIEETHAEEMLAGNEEGVVQGLA